MAVRHLAQENVLPTQSINDMAADQHGALWLGANTGLFHFDGLHCERIPLFSPTDSQYLYQVNKVMTDRNGVVYLAFLNNGLGVLQKDRSFKHYKLMEGDKSGLPNNAIDCITDVGDRVLLVFERGGFAFFHKKSEKFTHYLPSGYFPEGNGDVRLDYLYCAVEDPEHPGDAWIAGARGLFHWEHRQERLRYYPIDPGFSSRSPDRTIYLHADRKLYLGGFGQGLHIFDLAGKRWMKRVEQCDGLDISVIAFINRRDDHSLWLSTYYAGLCSYDVRTGHCTQLLPVIRPPELPQEPQRSTDAEIMKMTAVDDQSWALLKVSGLGLSMLYREQQLFRKIQTGVDMHRPVAHGSQHVFLITNRPYFFDLDVSTGTTTRIPIIPFLNDGGFRDGFRTPDGACYVVGWKGLYRFRPGKDPIARHVPLRLLDSLARTNVEILTALYDRRGRVWLGTRRGLYLASDPSGAREQWFAFADTIQSRPQQWTWFRDIHETPDGKIWFASDQGVGMTPDGGRTFQLYHQADFQRAGIGMADFSSLQHDRNGRLWVGSNSEGLGYFRWNQPLMSDFHPLLPLAGRQLPNMVSDLICDHHGMIWGIHQGGLFRLNTNDLSIQSFGKAYGLPEGRLYTLDTFPGGRLHVGAANGYFLFHPDEVASGAQAPAVRIQQAHLLGRAVPDTVYQPSALLLRYPQNSVHLQLAVRPSWLSTNLKIRYRLTGGASSGWIEAVPLSGISIWNVPAGSYTLQIQAADGLGNFQDDTILDVPVRVQGAWWNSWWFRVSAAILFLSAIAWYWIRRQRKLREEIAFRKRMVELELAGLRAQINPHFIFNSLNTVKWQIVNGDRRTAEAYLDRFSTLVRRSLDYTTQNLIPLEDELDFLCRYVELEQIRFKDSFEFELQTPDTDSYALIQVPPLSLQPYVENAIRHGLLPKEEGLRRLQVGIQMEEEICRIVIRDNGIGRKAAAAAQTRPGAIRPSFGMQISGERFRMLSHTVFQDFHLEVLDLHDEQGRPSGTEVRLSFRFAG